MSKVNRSLKKSVTQFERILGKRKSRTEIMLTWYFKWPISIDIVLIAGLLAMSYAVEKYFKVDFGYTSDSLHNVLNECISSAMSLGGFVLAAMAIVASIKQDVPIQDQSKATSPKGYFFNTKAYSLLMSSFSGACIVYGFSFLYFSVVRAFAESMHLTTLFYATFFGLILSLTTLIRCIWLIQSIIHISSLPGKNEDGEEGAQVSND